MKDKKRFLEIGDVGADCWALGWGLPWYPDPEFAQQGWRRTLEKARFQSPEPDQTFVMSNPLFAAQGSTKGSANSFLALIAAQIEGEQREKTTGVINWFDAQCGRWVDMDQDGHKESYYYETEDAYHIPATGNVAAASATRGDSLRRLFRESRRELLKSPCLARVDYPHVYVRSAEVQGDTLRFAVLKGSPEFTGSTELICEQIQGPVTVTRDGVSYDDYQFAEGCLTIRGTVDKEHVFEVRPSAALSSKRSK
jgi:hypothetical protein